MTSLTRPMIWPITKKILVVFLSAFIVIYMLTADIIIPREQVEEKGQKNASPDDRSYIKESKPTERSVDSTTEDASIPSVIDSGHLAAPRDTTCPPRHRLFFLKTHKCGSSTLQHMFMRYGRENQLTFALPGSFNYLGSPRLFAPHLIPPKLRTPDNKYDMFLIHTRFHQESIEEVMKEGAAYVTMVREPVSHFHSMWNFYSLSRHLNITLQDLLDLPYDEANRMRRLNKFGLNMQMYDLGFDTSVVLRKEELQAELQRLNRRFDLVMIMERFDESLVLLKDLMCWQTEDMAYVKINALGNRLKENFTKEDQGRVLEKSALDSALYNYFLKVFNDKVHRFGKERMKEELRQLREVNAVLQEKCSSMRTLTDDYYIDLCRDMTRGEKGFINQLRLKQIQDLSPVEDT